MITETCENCKQTISRGMDDYAWADSAGNTVCGSPAHPHVAEERDPADLPELVIPYEAQGTSVCHLATCGTKIHAGDIVLFDKAFGVLYCCRECLDKAITDDR